MSIAKMMTTKLVTVGPEDTVERMYEIFERLPIHHILVVTDGRLEGVVSDRDVLRNVSPYVNTKVEEAKDRFTMERKAHQIMNKSPATIHVNKAIRDAATVMLERKVGLLPVLDDDENLIGVLSWKDVMRFIIE